MAAGNIAGSLIRRFASRLRFPQLFFVTLALFLLNLISPDPLPFIEEILLGLLTVLLGSWADNRGQDDVRKPPEKDVTPREPSVGPHPGEE